MDRRSRHSRITTLIRVAAFSAAAALLATSLSMFAPAALISPARAATWTVDTTTRTEADVRAKWQQLQPAYTGTQYAVVPSVSAPYAPGDAAAGFRTDGLNMINFARYLAGLPADVTTTPTRNADAQYGAVLLAASSFSHTPAQPSDMPLDFYTRAKDLSTSKSNIGWGYATSHAFQKGCLDDNDSGNIVRVGHRRWLLNPLMKVTGIGYASARHTTYSIDSSRPAAEVDYSMVAWPSAGVFPIEFANSSTPWSITLNPAKYDWDATRAGHTITLRRVADGTTWTFDENDTNASGEYFNAEFSYIGAPRNAFIFRPNPADLGSGGYNPGDEFDVTLSGGIYAEGTRTPVTVTYRTRFMTLAGTPPAPPTPPTPPTPPVTPPPTPTPALMPVYRFYNKANGSHFYTASAAERDTVMARWSATYQYEGPAYSINTANPANCAPLFRFYNKVNGSHFYTASSSERDAVIARWSATYSYEGPVYNVSLTASASMPMYRFYHKGNGSHFYTVSVTERDSVIANLGSVYTYEGVTYFIGN